MDGIFNNLIITTVIFYWAYLIFLGFFVIMVLLNLYHLWRFGFFSLVNITAMLFFSVASVFLIFVSLNILAGLDWSFILLEFNNGSLNFNLFNLL